MPKLRISRRDFMRRTAGAAGATLAGRAFMLEPEALAAPRGPVGPSDTVRFGIIGVGMQGSGLLRTSIRLPGVECVAACDLYDGRRELAKEIVGKPIPTTRRYHELLDNKDIECIVAAVPDHWHKQVVVDCCNAGKDVYCEKPMTHEVGEGFEMIAAERKNNRIVQIGSQRRSSIVYAKAKELFEQGAIGEVSLVEGVMGRNEPCGAWQYAVPPDLSPETVDWETWLGTAPKRAFDGLRWTRWRCFQDYGEGIPGDLFVHLLTGIHYVTGITAPPERALSAGGLFRWNDGRDVPDVMTTLYEYPKFRATVRVTLNTDAPEITRFMGTRGTIEIRDNAVTLSPQDGLDHGPCAMAWPTKMRGQFAEHWHQEHNPTPGTQTTVESMTFYAPPGYNDDREHLWNYFQSVRTRRPSVEDGTFGNHTAIACHMANYSHFQKTVAVWDKSTRQIKAS
jgi:predicted dehydrogenase